MRVYFLLDLSTPSKLTMEDNECGSTMTFSLNGFIVHPLHTKKIYRGINDLNFYRIIKNSIILAEAGLGPKVIEISNYMMERRSIVFEKITPFDPEKNNSGLHNNLVLSDANSLLEKLHDLGYGLGYSRISSFGFNDHRKIYILNHESMYKLDEGEKMWMEDDLFETGNDVEEMKANDYKVLHDTVKNWESD